VTYFNGLSADGSYTAADLATAKSQAAKSAFTVVVMGEGSYTEKPGDIDDLALPAGQIAYVRELASTGTKVIIVLVGGRPRLLNGLTDSAHAVINAMLPGELGGQAIAEIIYGRVNPSGRLPITYPKDPANIMIPYNHRTNTQCANGYCQMQWEFGTGLSYTTFTYSALSLSKTSVSGSSDSLTATITVTNSGALAGKETVMLFLTQPFRKISVPEVKMLKKFKKVALNAGASTTVTFTLKAADWSVYDPQIGNGFSQVAEAGDFVVAIKPETDCNVYGTTNNPLCARFRVTAPSFSANAKTEL
jgi:beta-glucosidase